jgi:hypothetical protein
MELSLSRKYQFLPAWESKGDMGTEQEKKHCTHSGGHTGFELV